MAATGSFSINAQALSTGNHLVLDATAETDILSITSGGGNDQIAMGNNLTSEDLIDGGTGNDTLTFTDSNNAADDLDQVTNIETIILEDAATTITVVDSTVAADARLHINATALTAGQVLTLDLSAETNGNYKISSGADDDVITAGAGDDEFILADGNDQLAMGQNLTKDDIIDGGTGSDTLTFTDSNNAADDLDQVTNIETIILEDAATNITTKDSLVANAASLTLNAAALTATNNLIFDASAETNGSFVLTGGAGNDQVTMGQGTDQVSLGNGDDQLHFNAFLTAADLVDGGAGADTLTFTDNGQGTDELDNVLNFEAITLGDATTNLVTKDSLINDGASLSIDARTITTTNSLTFNAAQETNGSIILTAGLGTNDVTLGGHNDSIYFDDTLTSSDLVVGGTGNDTLYFMDNGLGTDELNNVTQIENIVFGNAATSIVTVDALVGTGLALDLDASALDAGNSFTLRASQESDGSINLTAGVGAVDLVMGQSDDTILMGTYLDVSDVIDGGSGNDTLSFTGDWTSTDRLDNVTNVENIVLGDNETKLVLTDNLVGLGQTVKITAEAVSATNYVNIIAEAETGSLHLIGGAGGDQFFMGEYLDASDIIDGGSGTDNLFFTDGNGATNELDNVTGIENISLVMPQQNLIVTNNFVSQGTAIALVATNLSASSSLTFDASAELDGYITVMAGQGVDDITLGQLNDTIYMDDNLTSADQIDGAAGEDTLHFTYTGVNTNLLDQVTNFEAIVLGDAATNLVLTNNLVSNGGTTTINGSSLSSS